MPYETLRFLINTFCVNANWLLTGTGNMFINTTENAESININPADFEIGKRLSKIQEQNKCPDKDMAKILGIYEYEYYDLKQGLKEPTIKILNNLKQSFNISVDWLLYGD